MRSLDVVEPQIAVERPLQGADTREVLATKGDAPVLMQDRALHAFDKAVGPRVSRFRARDANAAPLTAGDETRP